MTANPPRWHADPTGRHELRYWDGHQWSDHVSDRGVAAIDRLDGGASGRDDATIMPSSEGRSAPSVHEPMRVELPTAPRRTQQERPGTVTRPARRPRPIVTEAGWSNRRRLVAFVAFDLVVVAIVIWLVAR